jgi:hypothetical protein
MIITQLTGGLGNQMFQYALGRALSIKHQTDLSLDLRAYADQSPVDTPRSYELDVFQVPANIASAKLLKRWGRPNKYKVLLNQYFHLGLCTDPPGYIREIGHEFKSEILELPDNVYLSGYWQSEKYFAAIRGTILEDFSRRSTLISTKNKQLTSQITSGESVSLHVRRTDYVTNKNARAFHGICTISYYKKAMREIEKKVAHPTYFIFSDDPAWVKANIKSKHKTVYISHNQGRDAHEDIRLMSLCRHNIIANSSFSWWGAWLNQNPGKIVVAPKQWFRDKKIDTSDIMPAKWTRI